jgi:hypothetical protein
MKTTFISALAFASLSTLTAGTTHPGAQSAPRAAAQPHVNAARPAQPARSAATNRPHTAQPGAARYNSQRPNVGQTNSAHAANSARPNAAHVNSARPNSGQLSAQRSANTSRPTPAQTNATRSNPSHSNSVAQRNNAGNGSTHSNTGQGSARNASYSSANRGTRAGITNASLHGGRQIPQQRFQASFGRAHTFAMGHPTMIGGQASFQFGGYWFGIVDPWPAAWLYTDTVYVDFIGGEYVLVNVMHPGVYVAVSAGDAVTSCLAAAPEPVAPVAVAAVVPPVPIVPPPPVAPVVVARPMVVIR